MSNTLCDKLNTSPMPAILSENETHFGSLSMWRNDSITSVS